VVGEKEDEALVEAVGMSDNDASQGDLSEAPQAEESALDAEESSDSEEV
jgi:hypothetical protein